MATIDVIAAEGEQATGLPTLFQQYIHMTHYSRWRDDLKPKRREVWPETVERYVQFAAHLTEKRGYKLSEDELELLYNGILNTEAMPSMRLLMTAGPAAMKDNAAAYNCTYMAVRHVRAFDEAMYLLMCGTGVGFSVERQYIVDLPEVPERLFESDTTIVVEDSRRAWAASYRQLLAMLWAGHIPKWDMSKLRPAGVRLKTFGGRASGPAPLTDLFMYTVDVFKRAVGRKLTSIECHGLMCKIGDIVVSGGVRRSALISLSNPTDERMRDAKSGDWRAINPHYQLANNSAVWTEKPEIGRFMREWLALYDSKSGERGIVNRAALKRAAQEVGRDPNHEFGVNPCGEILLRDCQMCNLTEIIVRAGDTLEDLKRKATIATIMGTIQSTATDFDYLRPIWRKNCEEERLLGVGLGGELDHPVFAERGELAAEWKEQLREHCRIINREWARRLGINESAMITCQKPSGTASQVTDAASGGHARYAKYYVRRTRVHKLDPVSEVVIASGVPHEADAYKPENWVFEWPIKAPEGALTTADMSAIDQLERWLHTKRHYTEHNPSCTIHVKEHEWMEVGAWVYRHFDEVGGLSFLPADVGGHGYVQLPFEEITEAEYEKRLKLMPPNIRWEDLALYEVEDTTTSSRELACTAGACEIEPR